MKKVIMIIAVAAILVGCKGKGTRVQISDSVDKFNVEKLFVVDSITVYRFYDQGNGDGDYVFLHISSDKYTTKIPM